jgi:hypothetical protein
MFPGSKVLRGIYDLFRGLHFKPGCMVRTSGHTQTAPDAIHTIDYRYFILKGDCLHMASFDAGSASLA